MTTITPTITKEQIEALITHIEYITHVSPSGRLIRWCVITLQNGVSVSGSHQVLTPEHDNIEISQQAAYDDAMSVLYPQDSYFYLAG